MSQQPKHAHATQIQEMLDGNREPESPEQGKLLQRAITVKNAAQRIQQNLNEMKKAMVDLERDLLKCAGQFDLCVDMLNEALELNNTKEPEDVRGD